MYLRPQPTVHPAEVPATSAPLLGVREKDASWVLRVGGVFLQEKGPSDATSVLGAPVTRPASAVTISSYARQLQSFLVSFPV